MFKCKICNKEFEKSSQLAGHCSGHVRRRDVLKHNYVKKDIHICPICQKEFATGTGLGGHMHKHQILFEDLISPGALKSRLIDEYGHKCQMCNNTTHLNQIIPLELDHIDGDSTNNKKENLRIICPNCHALTSTYKGRNIGKNPDKIRAQTLKKYYGLYR